MRKIKIGLVDDQRLFQQAIASLLDPEKMQLVYEAEQGQVLPDYLSAGPVQMPDVILADLEMPGMDGLELTGNLLAKYPDIRVIILSVHAKDRITARMIQMGASGYLQKNCAKSELLQAITATYEQGFYITQNNLKALQAFHSKPTGIKNQSGIPIELSSREQDVLRLICKEMTNNEIADELYISVRTVEGHRNNLLAKTVCRNTAGLVLFAVKSGLYLLI